MRKVVISIINYNGNENTRECLKSLCDIALKDIELHIIVIDNASKVPFVLPPEKYGNLKISVIHNKKNLGFAGGHNIGIRFAFEKNADYIVILNNDTYVEKKFIEELVVLAEKEKEIAVISPKIYFANGYEFYMDRYKNDEMGKILWYAGGSIDWKNLIGHHIGVDEVDSGKYDHAGETDSATGCCMLVRLDVLKKSGVFDDRYFLYYEDSDLQERIRRLGYKIFFAPKSVIWHKNAGSSGGSGSVLQDYYISRNRLLFGYLYAPMKTKFALLRESVKILLSGRQWQKIGIRDFYLGKLGKGSFRPENT